MCNKLEITTPAYRPARLTLMLSIISENFIFLNISLINLSVNVMPLRQAGLIYKMDIFMNFEG